MILGWHAWVRPQDYFPAKWRITEEIKYRFDENQIEIPYQQIDVKDQPVRISGKSRRSTEFPACVGQCRKMTMTEGEKQK